MAILKCKMCGGDLNIAEGVTVCECDYCGTKQTVPTADDEKKLTLFARANRLRFGNEFDKAAGVYEAIVADFPEEAEAYWGLVLCRYGIEYVDDPATAKKIPTCHRSSFDSVMDDSNFELVLEYADPVARGVYREEAKQIEELRRGIIAVSSKEEPYDIFICYKETDEKGERTIDSVIAQDVYTALTDKGYRVFFSRISLEDKLGVEYEPYIFAALHSAKIMLAFGTDYEYYNAVWVKNEWSRFLQLIAKGEKKTLIPCFKGIDAYDMPKEFAKLQAQDMGKVGALQDLMRGIEKILGVEKPQPTTNTTNANATQLMLEGDVMYEGEVFANIPHGQGKATFVNGDRYEGEWSRGKRSGQGKMTWTKGGEWVGEFRDGQPWNGRGVYHFANGRYEGDVVNGAQHGLGIYIWNDGDIYEGEWLSDKKHGQGKMIWAKGGEWVGEFRNDKPWNGGNVYRYENGTYEGELVNGLKSGHGKFLWLNGTCYEGEWLNDQHHGQGTITWVNGDHCTGEFRDGNLWSGVGSRRYDNGTYEGELINGKRHGQGKMTWNNNSVWSGVFADDKPKDGTGVIYYDDGFYVGDLINGLKQGKGKYVWNDGDYYEGDWVNNQRHGYGRMVWAKGGEWSGEYRSDNYWNGTGTMHFTDGSSCIVMTKRGVHR